MTEKENGTVVRVVKTKDYTVMSNTHLKCKELSLKAKGLMSICLSLPDNWNYSISGLVALSSDGRDSVMRALKDLQEYGFLITTKEHNEKGHFKTIYTFYETPQETPKETPQKQNPHETDIPTVSGFPIRLNRCGFTDTVNPQQLNTNNKILKLNTKDNLLSEKEKKFEPIDLFNLYLQICVHFPQPQEMNNWRIQHAKARLKSRPQREFWQTAFNNAEKSKLLRAGDAKWFCFDWVLKNDINAQKLYEGNYGGGYTVTSQNNDDDKYAKKYGGLR